MEPEGVDRIEAREYFRHRWKYYIDSPPDYRLSILDSAAEFDPDNEMIWSERSAALYQLGRLDEALSSADRCLSLTSGSCEAWFWKGSVLVRKGLLSDAADCFEDALEIDPDSELAWLMLGWTERARNDLPKAKACYDRVLDLSPSLSLAYVERGLTSVKAGDLEAAQKDLLRALDLEPGSTRAKELLRSMGADLPSDEGKEASREDIEDTSPTVEAAEGAVPHVGKKVKVILEEETVSEPALERGIPTKEEGGSVTTGDIEVPPDEAARIPPPPAAPAPGPSGSGAQGEAVVYKWMRCPHCGDNIPLTTMERPLVVTCKSCGAKGKLVR